MSKHGHMPPGLPASCSQKDPGDHPEIPSSKLLKQVDVKLAEQGDTANIRQNTTNKGFFKGRRIN